MTEKREQHEKGRKNGKKETDRETEIERYHCRQRETEREEKGGAVGVAEVQIHYKISETNVKFLKISKVVP